MIERVLYCRGYLLNLLLESDLRKVITENISPHFKGYPGFLDHEAIQKALDRMKSRDINVNLNDPDISFTIDPGGYVPCIPLFNSGFSEF